MATTRKRLTLDIDESLQRRRKAAAALKGITMREFCEGALEDRLVQDPPDELQRGKSRREAVDAILARSKARVGGRKFLGNSADIIREERELRAEQIDNRT